MNEKIVTLKIGRIAWDDISDTWFMTGDVQAARDEIEVLSETKLVAQVKLPLYWAEDLLEHCVHQAYWTDKEYMDESIRRSYGKAVLSIQNQLFLLTGLPYRITAAGRIARSA